MTHESNFDSKRYILAELVLHHSTDSSPNKDMNLIWRCIRRENGTGILRKPTPDTFLHHILTHLDWLVARSKVIQHETKLAHRIHVSNWLKPNEIESLVVYSVVVRFLRLRASNAFIVYRFYIK